MEDSVLEMHLCHKHSLPELISANGDIMDLLLFRIIYRTEAVIKVLKGDIVFLGILFN